MDYFLEEDRTSIKFAVPLETSDKLDIILFGNTIVSSSFGYMQFKDMLNRVHYKRINKDKSTVLIQDLLQKDITIHVQDASVLSTPNRNKNLPGIIEINGERIEYFIKNGNILSQLRRGTLGTGVPTAHLAGLSVLDIGSTETIPYQDKHIVETFIGDGSTNNIPLNYTPASSNELDVFVAGYRLKKNPYDIFGKLNSSGAVVEPDWPDSPEGDITLPPEFTVNGTNLLSLTNDPPINSKIVVIKKIGKVWEDALTDSEIFRNLAVAYGGAIFDVTKNGDTYLLSLKLAGSGYSVGNILIIPGSLVGGVSPANDVTITVTEVSTDSTASIVGYTYTGVGRNNGFVAKSLEESDNIVANFLKNVDTLWPDYK